MKEIHSKLQSSDQANATLKQKVRDLNELQNEFKSLRGKDVLEKDRLKTKIEEKSEEIKRLKSDKAKVENELCARLASIDEQAQLFRKQVGEFSDKQSDILRKQME